MFFVILLLYFFVGILVSIIRLPFRWFRDSVSSARQDKRNFYKPILVVLLIAYAITRLHFVYDIFMSGEAINYTERDLTPRREQRFEKYVRLQEKTHYIDRYKNMIYYLDEDDRPILAFSVCFLTCSRRLYKFSDLVWDAHLSRLLEEKNEKKIAAYLESVKWLSEEEKAKTIQKFNSKPHK